MDLLENYPLKDLNTFGIDVKARYFGTITSTDNFRELLGSSTFKSYDKLILGGGSNILFTRDYPGLIIYNQILGIEIISENEEYALILASGGENWHDLVEYAIAHNLGGIENLSLIPGSVGAAPIQNIGAYGVELEEVLEYVIAIEISTGNERKFTAPECHFAYRNSIFKNELKDKFLITRVCLKLSKVHQLNLSYGAIKSQFELKNITQPTIRDVSNNVIEIRQSKLPDPAKIGNAGSFFKNPIIDKIDYEGLKLSFTDMPAYINNEEVKVPAAWLIEQCGWKGKRMDNIGVHEQQPLVLVNYGKGTGREIEELAFEIRKSVVNKFGIELEPEPRII